MSQEKRNFIARNDGFTCDACATAVPPARGTFRNHCPACLTSKHVDGLVPGDRLASCGGLMPAIDIEGSDPEKFNVVHQCQQCGHTRRNKVAQDDSRSTMQKIIADRLLPNLESL